MATKNKYTPGEFIAINERDYNFLIEIAKTDSRARRLLDYVQDSQEQMRVDGYHIRQGEKDKAVLSRAAFSAPALTPIKRDLMVDQMEVNQKAISALHRGGYSHVYMVAETLVSEPWAIRVKCSAMGELLFTEVVLWCHEQRYISISANMLKAAVMPRDEIEALERFYHRFGRYS